MRRSTLKAFNAGYLRGRQSRLNEDIATIGIPAIYTDSDGNEIWVRNDNSDASEEFVRTNLRHNGRDDKDLNRLYYNIDTREYDISPHDYHPSTSQEGRYLRGSNAGNLFTIARAKFREEHPDSKDRNVQTAYKMLTKWNKELRDTIYSPTSITKKGGPQTGNSPDAQRWFDYEFLVMYADLVRLVETARANDKDYAAKAAKVYQEFIGKSDEVTDFKTKIVDNPNYRTRDWEDLKNSDLKAYDKAVHEFDDHKEAAYSICQNVLLGSESYNKYLNIKKIIGKKLAELGETQDFSRQQIVDSVFSKGTPGTFPLVGGVDQNKENQGENSVKINVKVRDRNNQFWDNTGRQSVFFSLLKDGFRDSQLSTIPFDNLELDKKKGNKVSISDFRWNNLKGFKNPKDEATFGRFLSTDNDAKVRYSIMAAYSMLDYTVRDAVIQSMQEILDDIRNCYRDRAIFDRLKEFVDRTSGKSSDKSSELFSDD